MLKNIFRSFLIITSLFISNIFALDLNTATVAELKALKFIGQKKAEAIVAYREANGAFKSVDELKKVKGIGDKILKGLEGELSVSEVKVKATIKNKEEKIKENIEKINKSEVKAEDKK